MHRMLLYIPTSYFTKKKKGKDKERKTMIDMGLGFEGVYRKLCIKFMS